MNTRRAKLLPLLFAAVLGLIGGFVAQPVPASAEVHPYTTPGQRWFNDRLWNTVCNQYSTTVTRCRAEIMATQARVVDGKYQLVNEFVFNNLTYLPSNGANWRDKNTGEINPLARDGQFTGTDGRLWKTECATEWTGQNGCRSFTYATVVNATKGADGAWVFTPENKWVFNNVVQFVPGTRPIPRQYDNPCDAPPPAGFTFTREGRPHVIKPGYEPADHYNPISLANFIKVSLRSTTLSDADRLCFALLGAEHLIDGGKERTYQGRKSLWFPYPFGFSANPSLEPLGTGWYSGLGQAGAMTAFMELADFTGNSKWYDYAEQIFESYFIPFDQGGFTNRDGKGFLWFEEYPTEPIPTTVYNGHFQNVLGLYSWATHTGSRSTGDQRAWNLYDEAIAALRVEVPKMRIPIDGGTMSSYDMVRGYPAAPLRAVAVEPTPEPTPTPTASPTPSVSPSPEPSSTPTAEPTQEPTGEPTQEPTGATTGEPTQQPTGEPTEDPTQEPTATDPEETPAGAGVRSLAGTKITDTLLNGKKLGNNLPIGTQANLSGNLLLNHNFADSNKDGTPDSWTVINRNTSAIRFDGRWMGIRPQGAGKGWAGVEQVIDVSPAIAGKTLSLSFESRLQITAGQSGTGGKVPVYSICPGPNNTTVSTLIHENAKNRTKDAAWSSTSFKAPAVGCKMRIQFLTYSYAVTNTTAWYTNAALRIAENQGQTLTPSYDMSVRTTPENVLKLKGTGAVEVQAYDGGRWHAIDRVNLSAAGASVTIPEQYTGRNVNINYHDGHISELQRIACHSGVRLFDTIAEELSHTATKPYDAGLFDRTVNGRRSCAPETMVLAMGEEVIEVAAEVEPMEVTPAAVPMSMEHDEEAPEDR
ncbi:hypothetical protein GCM10028820_07500 [Tessaracoccus terricola]